MFISAGRNFGPKTQNTTQKAESFLTDENYQESIYIGPLDIKCVQIVEIEPDYISTLFQNNGGAKKR